MFSLQYRLASRCLRALLLIFFTLGTAVASPAVSGASSATLPSLTFWEPGCPTLNELCSYFLFTGEYRKINVSAELGTETGSLRLDSMQTPYTTFKGAELDAMTASGSAQLSGSGTLTLAINYLLQSKQVGWNIYYLSVRTLSGAETTLVIDASSTLLPLNFADVPLITAIAEQPFEYFIASPHPWHELSEEAGLSPGSPAWLQVEPYFGAGNYGPNTLLGYRLYGNPGPSDIGTAASQLFVSDIFTEDVIDLEIIVLAPLIKNCYASRVVEFEQGPRLDNLHIGRLRSDPEKALGAPQENDTWNFVSLGFGGHLTLELGQPLYDDGTSAPDLMVVETTWGPISNQPCYSWGYEYPEKMRLEVSMDGIDWQPVGDTYCRSTRIDLSPVVGLRDGKLPYVRFIRITDASDPAEFSGSANGYDVDAVLTCPELFGDYAANSRTVAVAGGYNPNFVNAAPEEEELGSGLRIYPQPARDMLHIELSDPGSGRYQLRLYSLEGRLLLNQVLTPDAGGKLSLEVGQLPEGMYLLQLQDQQGWLSSLRVIKN